MHMLESAAAAALRVGASEHGGVHEARGVHVAERLVPVRGGVARAVARGEWCV